MKKSRKIIVILLIVFGFLVLLGLSLGFVIQWYINDQIDETKGVSGNVGRVQLSLFQGFYSIQNIDLALSSPAVDVPVLQVKRVAVNINWGQLLSGSIVGQIYVNNLEVRQITKKSAEGQPEPQGPALTSVFRSLAPVELDLLRFEQGVVVLRDETKDVPFSIDFTELQGQIENLTNSADLSDSLYATVEVQGIVKGTGALNVFMTFNPVATDLQFHLVVSIADMHLTDFNDYVSEIAGLTFEGGTLSIHADIRAEEGTIRGMVQSTYKNISILDPDANQNFLKQLRDAVAEALGEIAEDEQDRIVTRVPVNMKVSGTRPDVLMSVVNVMQATIERAALPVAGEVLGEVE